MPLVLDPQISYDSMKTDYANDPILVDHLEQSKLNIFASFNEHYVNNVIPTPSSVPSVQSLPVVGSPQKSFIAWYCRKEKTSIMKLRNISNFLQKISTPVIQFNGGWVKELNFQTSFALHVIFYVFLVSNSTAFTMPKTSSSCPGSAVAVERIFSGGRYTISSVVQAFRLIPFISWCLLRSSCIWPARRCSIGSLNYIIFMYLFLCHLPYNTAWRPWSIPIL